MMNTPLTDRELLEKYAQGDEAAFAVVVDRHVKMVFAAGRRLVGPGAADDVTQAVFMVLAEKRQALRGEGSLAGWLYQVTRYCCRNWRRQEQRRLQHERASAMPIEPVTSDAPLPAELEALLDAGLHRLKSAEREAVLLRYVENRGGAETAAALGISEAAAKKRAERGLEKLRAFFGGKGYAVQSSALAVMLASQNSSAIPAHLLALTGAASKSGTSLLAKQTLTTLWTLKIQAAAAVVLIGTVAGVDTWGAATYIRHSSATAAAMPLAAAPAIGAPAEGREIPAGTATATVVDSQGLPVAFAYVQAVDGQNIGATRSETSGFLEISPLTSEPRSFFIISGRAQRMGLVTVSEKQNLPQVQLLWKIGNAHGRIVDSRGYAVNRANVRLKITLPDSQIEIQSRTNADGDYTFYPIPLVPGAKMQPRVVTATGLGSEITGPEITLNGTELRTEFADFTIPGNRGQKAAKPRIEVGGRFVDENGKGIAGVALNFGYTQNKYNTSEWVSSDAEGYWHMRLRPGATGPFDMRAWHEDYISFAHDPWKTPAEDEVRSGKHVFVMKRGVRIHGVVKNQQGQPVANVSVLSGMGSSYGENSEQIEVGSVGRTNSKGEFTLGALPEKEIELRLNSYDYAPTTAMVSVKDGASVEVVMDEGLKSAGRVVDSQGNPLSGVKVSVDRWNTPKETSGGGIYRIATSDADGRFELKGLPRVGTLDTYLSKAGYYSGNTVGRKGGDDLGTLTLYKTAVISGTVVDADSETPLATFKVTQGSRDYSDKTKWNWFEPWGVKTVKDSGGRFSEKMDRYILSADGKERGPEFELALRVEAEGYEPVVIGPVRPEQKLENQTVKPVLKKMP